MTKRNLERKGVICLNATVRPTDVRPVRAGTEELLPDLLCRLQFSHLSDIFPGHLRVGHT